MGGKRIIDAAASALFVLALGASLLAAPPARAAVNTSQGIAAVVNDEIVSVRDLNERIALFLITANLEDRPEIRERLTPEILQVLIDDTLKRQEARRLNIVVDRQDLDDALGQVARQLRLQPTELPAYLSGRGAEMATLIEQVETEIAWIRVVNRLAGGSVVVRDDEVDEEIHRRREAAGSVERRVAEISLPFDTPQEELRARELAARLIQQLQGGATFPTLARTYSGSASAAQGGDLGWVRQGQLDPQIERLLDGMTPGDLTGPVRIGNAYMLLLVIDRRQSAGLGEARTWLTLQQVFLPQRPGASAEDVARQIETARRLGDGVSSCDELDRRARALPEQVVSNQSSGELRQLPPELQPVVARLGSGDVSEAIRSTNGVALLMVCAREEEPVPTDIRESVRRGLLEQRMAAAARRYLRDLRRTAMLDRRL